METKNIYSLPVAKKDLSLVISDKRAHNKDYWEHALDFTLPEGTEILAAQKGVVLLVLDSSKEGGSDMKYNDEKYLNRIVIKHDNGEITEYAHLKYKGAFVKKGDEVNQGDVIGLSGNTGLSTEPHLHFHVAEFKDEFKTRKIRFDQEVKVIRGPPYKDEDFKKPKFLKRKT